MDPHKAVEEGVDGTVGQTDAQGKGEEDADSLPYTADSQHVEVSQSFQEGEHVEGEPADEESQNHRHHHPEDAVQVVGALSEAFARQQAMPDAAVAAGDDSERQHEAQDAFRQRHRCEPRYIGVADHTSRDAHLVQVVDLPKHHGRHSGQAGHSPHQAADGSRPPRAKAALGPEGVDDGEVAVYAHTRDEEDTGIQVECHEGPAKLAHKHAKDPVVVKEVVDSPEREAEDAEQVGQRQAEHIRVSYRLAAALLRQHEYYQAITHGSQYENDAVDSGDELILMPGGQNGVTGGIGRIVHRSQIDNREAGRRNSSHRGTASALEPSSRRGSSPNCVSLWTKRRKVN